MARLRAASDAEMIALLRELTDAAAAAERAEREAAIRRYRPAYLPPDGVRPLPRLPEDGE